MACASVRRGIALGDGTPRASAPRSTTSAPGGRNSPQKPHPSPSPPSKPIMQTSTHRSTARRLWRCWCTPCRSCWAGAQSARRPWARRRRTTSAPCASCKTLRGPGPGLACLPACLPAVLGGCNVCVCVGRGHCSGAPGTGEQPWCFSNGPCFRRDKELSASATPPALHHHTTTTTPPPPTTGASAT